MSDDPLWSPGLKKRANRDGSVTWYWVGSKVVRNTRGFEPKTARLIGITPEDRARECQRLTRQLKLWLDGGKPREHLAFDGTIGSLLDFYEYHPESPVQDLKWCSVARYKAAIKLLRKSGHRKLSEVQGIHLKRLYRDLKKPAEEGGRERITRAHFTCGRLRDAVGFGAALSLDHCERLTIAFSKIRLSAPAARKDYVTYDQAVAIISEANARGHHSIALGQAMQYELTLRQKDVIGEWIPEPYARDIEGGIRRRGHVWANGCLWSHVDAAMVLRKTTTKTGQDVEFDLPLYPLVMAEIDRVPPERRIGPMVINEKTGLPWAQDSYIRVWRDIARAVGVPDTVQNRDSRAGGITELGDAGIDIELMRHHAQHRDVKTTGRYNRRTLKKTSAVAELRAAARAKKNDA